MLQEVDSDGNVFGSIEKVATTFGERSSNALREIDIMSRNFSQDFKPPTEAEAKAGHTQGATFSEKEFLAYSQISKKAGYTASGEIFDTFAKLYGLTKDEKDLIQKRGFKGIADSTDLSAE
jgi:tRNA A37 threonylcarbamoyltransferase TsaD